MLHLAAISSGSLNRSFRPAEKDLQILGEAECCGRSHRRCRGRRSCASGIRCRGNNRSPCQNGLPAIGLLGKVFGLPLPVRINPHGIAAVIAEFARICRPCCRQDICVRLMGPMGTVHQNEQQSVSCFAVPSSVRRVWRRLRRPAAPQVPGNDQIPP